MGRLWILALPLTISSLFVIAQTQPTPKPAWTAAVYHDMTIGKSTKEDALRELGKPRFSGKEPDTDIPIMTYDVSDPVRGTLIVYLNNDIIDGITLVPKKQLTKSEAIRMLGPNPLRVRYAVADCLTEGGSAPIYESANGPIEHLEYREQGKAIVLHDGDVQAIVFVHKSFGLSHNPCVGKKDKKSGRVDPSG